MLYNELYNYSTDYRPVQFSKYGEDDVNLSQTIINDLREPYGQTKLSNVYYPDTDLNFDSQSVLQHIHFKEQIVPSSFDPKMHVTPDVILQYASEATHAWENGVPTNEIIKQIKAYLSKSKADKLLCTKSGKCALRINIPYIKNVSSAWMEHEMWITSDAKVLSYDDIEFMK